MSSVDINKLRKAEALLKKVQNHVAATSFAESRAHHAAFTKKFVKNGRVITNNKLNDQKVENNEEYQAAAKQSAKATRMLSMVLERLHGVEQEIEKSMKRSSMKRSSGGTRRKHCTRRKRTHRKRSTHRNRRH